MDTTQTIFELMDYINYGFNSKEPYCLAAFADLAKAFDSLDRHLLLKKLDLYGIRGIFLKLLTSYLTDRMQQVILNGTISDTKPIDFGVPQGSILGPLLFIIFVNDLPLHNFDCRILIYADDTVLYFRHANLKLATETIQNDLDLFNDWCLFNRLSLNIKKTKLMLFVDNKRRKVDQNSMPKIGISGKSLDYVNNYTYLGVKLDDCMNLQAYFSEVISRLQHKIVMLCKIRPFIDTNTALIIYKTHILSQLEYGSIFIDNLPVNYLNKLQRLQNRCLRICNFVDKDTSNYELHVMSKLLPLRLRRKKAISTFMFKKIRRSPEILLEPIRAGNRSNNKRLIRLLMPKTKRFKTSLSYAGYQWWNNLPEDLRMNNDINSFKKCLCKYMYEKFCEDGFV